MSNFIKLALLAILLILIAPKSAGFCKWVDENGVTHYAETCPEDADTKEVPVEPAPTQEQVDAAMERTGRIRAEMKARNAQRDLESAQKSQEQKDLGETTDAMTRKCAEARWNLEILRKQLPVYYDEENQLHYNRSLHDYWYEGPRSYLDDQQRATQIIQFTQAEEQSCTESEADIRERIKMYMDKRHSEVCRHLENNLADMQKLSTGIPSSEMRELQEMINTRCR